MNPKWHAEQSRLRIQEKVNPEILQSWALNLLNKYSHETNFGGYFAVEAQLPVGLDEIWKHQRPNIVLRDARHGGERYVCLDWAGGTMGRWGLAVGSSSFVLEPGMESTGSDPHPWFWRPGVYFFQSYR